MSAQNYVRQGFLLSLEIRSPFLFAGLRNTTLGVDASALRDEDNLPIIPTDQIRGVLRAACEILAGWPEERDNNGKVTRQAGHPRAGGALSRKHFEMLFGQASARNEEAAEQDRPERGILQISDATARNLTGATGRITRIEIDDETGAVKTGALQVVELCAPLGQVIAFQGTLFFDCESAQAEALSKALHKAIQLIPAIGAYKSAGFGEVVKAELSAEGKLDRNWTLPKSQNNPKGRQAYRVTFDRSILVDSKRIAENVYEGSEVVPGAVFKGALARALKLCGHDPEQDKDWEAALANLQISHAFPEVEPTKNSGAQDTKIRDIASLKVPLSVTAAKIGDKIHFRDMLLDEAQSKLLFFEDGKPVVPAFPLDWKESWFSDFSKTGYFPASADLVHLPRVHVAIDPENWVADDHKLYSTIAISTRDRGWRLIVDATDVPQDKASSLLGLLEQGLDPLGRTGAVASFEKCTEDELKAPFVKKLRSCNPPKAEPLKDQLYAITLITPAMMVDAQKIAGREVRMITEEDYKAFWENAVGGTLDRAFSTAHMAGGYIAMRRRLYGKTYYPFVLTDPGSVFLIKNPDVEKLNEALRSGLHPMKQSGVDELTWRNCPYLPENGYGEIACNLVALSKETSDV